MKDEFKITYGFDEKEEHNMVVETSSYMNNDSLAVIIKDKDSGETWCVASVNLDPFSMMELDKNEFYGDFNNSPDILDIMTEEGIIRPTGKYAQSGFFTYQSYELIGYGE